MKVFVYSTGQDTNGNGMRIKQGFDRQQPDVQVDTVSMRQSWIGYPEQYTGSKAKRRKVATDLYDAADIVHLFNSLDGWQTLDMRDGRRRCKPIVLHHHGTNFRNDHANVARGAENIGAVQIASTLDLVLLEPNVQWLPAIYNIDELREIREREYQPDRPFRIAHAPTNRAVKGTEAVLAAVKELRGEIEFDLIERTRWSECLKRIARADLVVDQLTLGTGSLAVEAWAMGIPVVAGVADPVVRAEMLKRWKKLPFVEADARSLSKVLRRLLGSADARAEAAERGNAHAIRWHGEPNVVAQLMEIYSSIGPSHYPSSSWRGVKPWRKRVGSVYTTTRRDAVGAA